MTSNFSDETPAKQSHTPMKTSRRIRNTAIGVSVLLAASFAYLRFHDAGSVSREFFEPVYQASKSLESSLIGGSAAERTMQFRLFMKELEIVKEKAHLNSRPAKDSERRLMQLYAVAGQAFVDGSLATTHLPAVEWAPVKELTRICITYGAEIRDVEPVWTVVKRRLHAANSVYVGSMKLDEAATVVYDDYDTPRPDLDLKNAKELIADLERLVKVKERQVARQEQMKRKHQ